MKSPEQPGRVEITFTKKDGCIGLSIVATKVYRVLRVFKVARSQASNIIYWHNQANNRVVFKCVASRDSLFLL